MKNNRVFYNVLTMFIMLMVTFWFVSLFTGGQSKLTEVDSTTFVQQLKEDKISEITVQERDGIYVVEGVYKDSTSTQSTNSQSVLSLVGLARSNANKFVTSIAKESYTDVNRLVVDAGVKVSILGADQSSFWISNISTFIFFAIIGLVGFMYIRQAQGGGRNPMSFGKAKTHTQNPNVRVRFSDVAGAEEEKQELVEVVEFLKDRRRFVELGARIPAGVLLEGPPGTGKTLLAKAVAGEANVPFYSISGSEFVEMFVGVGASRVRDLFEQAKKTAPAIIFIDEIDAVGRQRGAGMGGGHDEREQTLNQLLVEMDGFSGTEGIIVIAATNRSDVLDPALLRPGRFDRQILVGRPDVKGREAILKVHARNKKIASDVDLKIVAQQTPGFSGAELENLLNEAALVAARRNKKAIDALDIDEAHDRVIAGPAKKDRAISKREREMIAYHEAGHTVAGLVLSDAQIVHKVTIVPRGRAGGYAVMLPKEDRFLMTKNELFQQVVGLLGGRVAEEIFFNEQTTGASNDFQQATNIVRSMVTEYGMVDELGTIQYEGHHQVFIGRDYGQTKAYSEQVAAEIDNAVRKLMKEAHDKAYEIIMEHKEQLTIIAEKLLEVETLDERAIRSLFETGEMPVLTEEEYPSELDGAASFDEVKEALQKKEQHIEQLRGEDEATEE